MNQSGTVQLYWGGQDHAGQFHADYFWAKGNLGMSLFFLGPYLLLAMSALVAWRQRASLVVLMLNFLATPLLWLGSVAALASVATSRLANLRSRTSP